jgi:hypothetical protein
MDARSQRFVDTVIQTSASRKGVIEKGAVLWRAQLDHSWCRKKLSGYNGQEILVDVGVPVSPERMRPQPDRAIEGRVNPKGIPCLYFSTDRDTAMTEMRPWVDACISVAQFVILRDLTVVDCSTVETLNWHSGLGEPEPGKREELVWGSINRGFSEPVTRQDDIAEYAPTQVLAEALRSAGYDGIVYSSKLGSGKTVAIFDLAGAELANCQLYRVEAVNLTFSVATRPYYLEK